MDRLKGKVALLSGAARGQGGAGLMHAHVIEARINELLDGFDMSAQFWGSGPGLRCFFGSITATTWSK
jgi:hypothetical protein